MNEVIDQALKILRKKSIDGYEIYLNQSSHFDIESKDGKIETLETSRYLGMAFRILNHQRMGFSYTTFSDPSRSSEQNFSGELDRMIEKAISTCSQRGSSPAAHF
jgi:predicted Zn-dependent protease